MYMRPSSVQRWHGAEVIVTKVQFLTFGREPDFSSYVERAEGCQMFFDVMSSKPHRGIAPGGHLCFPNLNKRVKVMDKLRKQLGIVDGRFKETIVDAGRRKLAHTSEDAPTTPEEGSAPEWHPRIFIDFSGMPKEDALNRGADSMIITHRKAIREADTLQEVEAWRDENLAWDEETMLPYVVIHWQDVGTIETEKGKRAAAVKQLLDAGLTPDQIAELARNAG